MSFSHPIRRNANGRVPRALTIAGSDSGGGAGIQADLKTMHQLGVYGSSVLTAVTAQNTVGVQGVFEVSPDFVALQLDSVLSDIGADAVKTGMLANEAIVNRVCDVLQRQAVPHLVVDPVMVAKGGEPLIESASVAALRDRLLPMADVVTPNIPETSVLYEHEVRTWEDCHQAAKAIAAMGPRTVIIKGGHMEHDYVSDAEWMRDVRGPIAIDIVYSHHQFTYFVTPRIHSRKTHGTGCTFSAAITSMLASGVSVLDAIATAKSFICQAIDGAKDWDVGAGHGPTDHSANFAESTGIQPSGVYLLENGLTWIRIDEVKAKN